MTLVSHSNAGIIRRADLIVDSTGIIGLGIHRFSNSSLLNTF